MEGLFISKIAIFAGLILSVVAHEVSHGAAADAQGDPTPRAYGRLSLNPFRHLDPLGTLAMILIVFAGVPIFGWAKPVPIDPRYFRDYRKGVILVALAGPFANLSLLILSLFFVYLLFKSGVAPSGFLVGFLALLVLINYMLMLFNLLPIPPLDGSRVVSMFLPWRAMVTYNQLAGFGLLVLLFLVFFDSRLHILSTILNLALTALFYSVKVLFGSEFAQYVVNCLSLFLG